MSGTAVAAAARRRRLLPAFAAASVILVAATVWMGDQVWATRNHLLRAAALIQQFEHEMVADDIQAAGTTLSRLQAQAHAARKLVDGADWRAGTRLPLVGDDLGAVRVVATVLDELSREVLPTLLHVAGTVTPETLLPSRGHVNVAPLARAADPLRAADAAAGRAVAQLTAIHLQSLNGRVRAAVVAFDGGIVRLRGLTSLAARAASLLPAMLGEDRPRTYLVLFYNLAEVRASGGMPGAFAVLQARQGVVRMIDQGTAGVTLGSFGTPVLPLDPGMRALYSDRLGTYPADINLTPDFPTTAALAREMYRRRTGRVVDGVLATDPVALSYLLRATGPVLMSPGPALTADNAVRLLLSEVYARFPLATDQDRYFAQAARNIFETLSRGVADPQLTIGALARAAGERRLLVWSADPREQAGLAGTVLGGTLPTDGGGGRPTIGVFLNDGSGAKLDYYLTHDARLSAGACRVDGRRAWDLRVVVGSTAPASGLSPSVLGLGLGGSPYTIRINLMVFGPIGGSVVAMRLDGAPIAFGSGVERQRLVGIATVYIRPGTTRTVDVSLLTPAGPGPLRADPTGLSPRLWVTPGIKPWQLVTDSANICPVRQ